MIFNRPPWTAGRSLDAHRFATMLVESRRRPTPAPAPAAAPDTISVAGVQRFEDGRQAVLAHAGDNPYTRMMTGGGPVCAYVSPADGAVAWIGPGLWGPVACAVGPVGGSVRLMGELRATGALGDIRWVHLPRASAEQLTPHLTARRIIGWDLAWLEGAPPAPHPLAGRVAALDESAHPAINRLLDEALPDSSARPGAPMVRGWYGIREPDGALAACAADESHGGVGFLGGIAVAAAHRGRGLGTALTATVTRHLAAAYGQVALGVMAENVRALALYRRLGFTGGIPRSSVSIA
jgi:ribosomal protein S18 acetylase RimI-like enzyme